MPTRLIIHTDSLEKSDVHTFKAAGFLLKSEYERLYPSDTVQVEFVKSGIEIVSAINKQAINSIISLDIVSHGNQGGIHIARKLSVPVESGIIQKRAHVLIRETSDRPQTSEHAEFIEQSMHGIYTDWSAKKGVSYYYNQTFDSSTDIAYLSAISVNRFTKGAFVEFHGCRTAEIIPGLNTYFKDNFAKQFSDHVMNDVVVVGHITNSNPNKTPTGKFSDYRHGVVNVYKNGSLVKNRIARANNQFENSSTP